MTLFLHSILSVYDKTFDTDKLKKMDLLTVAFIKEIVKGDDRRGGEQVPIVAEAQTKQKTSTTSTSDTKMSVLKAKLKARKAIDK